MVENDSVVAKLTAEAEQIVIVSVTGSQEDKALEDLVSKYPEHRTYGAIFQSDARMLWTYFWVSLVAREEPKRLNATREVARRMVRLTDGTTSDLGKEDVR
jgi:hypothetical protein